MYDIDYKKILCLPGKPNFARFMCNYLLSFIYGPISSSFKQYKKFELERYFRVLLSHFLPVASTNDCVFILKLKVLV